MIRPAFAALIISSASPLLAEDLLLSLPVDCTLGQDCYIQQYMDRDPGEGSQDYHCRGLTYDGHKGTDFAVPTRKAMEEGVNVLAAADGRVRGFRDGMSDVGWTEETAASIEGKECGNGVALVHPGGWETQYCHLKEGSIAIKNDQPVKRGQVLGQIGQSGRAEFPHLHMSVRQGGKPVDPFDPDGTLSCDAPGDSTLWADTPTYQPGGLLLTGIVSEIPEYEAIKAGLPPVTTLSPTVPMLVIYGFTYGTVKDDILRLTLSGPDGEFVNGDTVMKGNHAQAYRAQGKRKRRHATWPAGTYNGTATLLRDGEILSQKTTTVEIK